MQKPKGVWLQTTELYDVREATVVREEAFGRSSATGRGRKASQPSPLRPILLGCLALCCCMLLALAFVRLLFPPPETIKSTRLSASAPYNATASFDEVGLGGEKAAFGETVSPVAASPVYSVRVLADGQEYLLNSGKQTVSQALQELGLTLSVQDEISLPLSTLIEADTQIEITRLYSRLETETEEIAPTRKRVEDANLAAGSTQVVEEGQPGLREHTVRVSYRDGEEIDRTVISSRVLQEPGVTTVAYGTMALASRSGSSEDSGSAITVNGENFNYTQKLSMESTAYTWTGNTTATGSWPARGTVAVDPRVIPLGSKLYIEGYGFATATDTGGAIKGSIIDVYFPSYDECIQWGRKHGLSVYVLE